MRFRVFCIFLYWNLNQAVGLFCSVSLAKHNFYGPNALQNAFIRSKGDIFSCRRPRRWRLFLILLWIIFARRHRGDSSCRWCGIPLWRTAYNNPITFVITSPTRVRFRHHLFVSNTSVLIDSSNLTCAPTCGLLAILVVFFYRRRGRRRSRRFPTTAIAMVRRGSLKRV